ncbi:hypothetical protein LJR296_003207 [Cupriavidus necator]|uniref:hypothetical protein n=1 Tax=Cupriavidus necator TaxID=106590 RepID=UPI003ECCF5E4
MTGGIQVLNDWGTVQVDADWAAMSLRHKQQISIATPAQDARAFDGALTFPAKAPMVFWKSSVPIFVLASVDNGSGTWTFVFRSTDPTTATVYAFDTPEWTTQTYGLEIFNAQGVKVFGDHLSPLKLAAVVPLAGMPYTWDGLQAGSYAVSMSDPGFMAETYYADVPKTAVWSCGAMDRPRGGQTDWTLSRDSIPVELQSSTSYPAKFMLVADVAGL